MQQGHILDVAAEVKTNILIGDGHHPSAPRPPQQRAHSGVIPGRLDLRREEVAGQEGVLDAVTVEVFDQDAVDGGKLGRAGQFP